MDLLLLFIIELLVVDVVIFVFIILKFNVLYFFFEKRFFFLLWLNKLCVFNFIVVFNVGFCNVERFLFGIGVNWDFLFLNCFLFGVGEFFDIVLILKDFLLFEYVFNKKGEVIKNYFLLKYIIYDILFYKKDNENYYSLILIIMEY